MAGLVPLPTHVHHSTTRLSHSQAHSLLSSFLQTAETDPAYRPDSTLSQSGVQSSSAGAGQNLTLNHLERILKGIAGERVGGTDSFDKFFGYRDPASRKRKFPTEQGDVPSSPPKRQREEGMTQEIIERTEQDGSDEPAVVAEETDDWQDKEDYEHAQREGAYDLLERDEDPTRVHGRTNEADAEDVMVDVEGGEDEEVVAGGSGERREEKATNVVDKKARKQAKKGRRKEEQKVRQKEKQQTKSKG